MEVEDRAVVRDAVRPSRGPDEHTLVLPSFDAEVRDALLRPAGIASEPEYDRPIPWPATLAEPTVGPAGAIPVMTPDTVRLGPGYTADYTFNALTALGDSVTIWPELLERPWNVRTTGRNDRYWSWVRFEVGDRMPLDVIGYPALDAILAACWHRTEAVRAVLDAGHYVRVPFMLIGHDKRADFPVLYRSHGVLHLHTLHRRREDLTGLRECTLTVFADRP